MCAVCMEAEKLLVLTQAEVDGNVYNKASYVEEEAPQLEVRQPHAVRDAARQLVLPTNASYYNTAQQACAQHARTSKLVHISKLVLQTKSHTCHKHVSKRVLLTPMADSL